MEFGLWRRFCYLLAAQSSLVARSKKGLERWRRFTNGSGGWRWWNHCYKQQHFFGLAFGNSSFLGRAGGWGGGGWLPLEMEVYLCQIY